ncbi:MAG: ornithine carbamoyltransferase [Anaerolineae bacterium]
MKDFISLSDLTPESIMDLLDLAIQLKQELAGGEPPPLLKGQVLGMVFQKPSLRTRVSFDVAMLQLGGHALYLSPNEIQLGQRESTGDVARVLSRYVNGIMARVFAHAHVVELARAASVPVINGLSDYSHPCQGLADLLTVYEKRGSLKGLKMTYLGDGNNVATSLMFGGALTGMRVVVATPPGYEPTADVVDCARALGRLGGGSIEITNDPAAAARGADVLYTDVWASMGQESEQGERKAIFPPYQVNAARLAEAQADALVLHCLPAHRGDEITDDVIDGPNSAVFDQAENRLHAQKAVLVKLMAPH